jgi:diguanylate cyclase (GGDEF)-like protein/PAS domain S-box-containing protein
VHAEQDDGDGLALPVGGLDGFPGPVLIFGPQGRLESAAPADCLLAVALRRREAPDLCGLVEAVTRSATARLDTIQVEAEDGTHAFDLTVLPLEGGGCAVLGHDVSLHHNLRAALVESRQRYKDFVEISSDFAWETGGDGGFVFVSPRGALGHSAATLVGRDPGDLVLEWEPGGDLPFHARVPADEVEVWLRRADGGSACLSVSAKPIYDREGRWVGARGVCRDITGDRERDSQLARARNRERILNHIVRTFRDEVDPSDMLRVAAETVARGLGAESCQIFRRRIMPLDDSPEPGGQTDDLAAAATAGAPSSTGDLPALEGFTVGVRHGPHAFLQALPVLERLDGSDGEGGDGLVEMAVDGRDVMAAATRHHHRLNGAVVLWRSVARGPWGDDDRLLLEDIADQIAIANEQIAAHEDILRISRTDGLTALFNRRAFFEEVARRFHRLGRSRASAALMYVDLDNFKAVNDARGHGEGDLVLRAVRDMLISNTRPTDLVARLGGDEFALWLEAADHQAAGHMAQRLLSLAEDVLRPRSGAPDRPLGFSIGVAVHDPSGEETLDQMIARADQAMYTVKRGGKFGYAVAPSVPAAGTEGGACDGGGAQEERS